MIEVLRRMSEEGIASFFNEVMANDALRRALASAGERFVHNKSRFDRNVETLLDFINIPSKRDIRELKTRIDHLNGQLLNLNLKMDRLTKEGEEAPAPKSRARTPRRKHE